MHHAAVEEGIDAILPNDEIVVRLVALDVERELADGVEWLYFKILRESAERLYHGLEVCDRFLDGCAVLLFGAHKRAKISDMWYGLTLLGLFIAGFLGLVPEPWALLLFLAVVLYSQDQRLLER